MRSNIAIRISQDIIISTSAARPPHKRKFTWASFNTHEDQHFKAMYFAFLHQSREKITRASRQIMGQTTRGGREGVRAARGINMLPQNDHQQITRIILHMSFGLPGPLWTSFEAPEYFSDVNKYARCGYTNVTYL